MISSKTLEKKMNNLWFSLREEHLSKDEISSMNLLGFLYSVDRVNIVQAVAQMTELALNHGYTIQKVKELLE